METENPCFCELAPLYALDALSDVERIWVEQQVAACPDLAAELLGYQAAVAALPYGVEPLPLSPDLKNRLFDRLELDAPAQTVSGAKLSEVQPPEPCFAVRSADLNWQPHAIPGVMVAIVRVDEVKREIVGFLKAEPGVQYPWHRHAAIEELFMLEGDLAVGDEVYGAGDYIRSHPGSGHAPYTRGGCRFYFHTSMDDEYPDLVAASSR